MDKGLRKVSYATVSLSDTTEANALPANTSARKAELIAPSLEHYNWAKGSG